MEEVCLKSTVVPMSPTFACCTTQVLTVKVTLKTLKAHKSQFCPLPDSASVHKRERSIESYIIEQLQEPMITASFPIY
jgi:hypothetical protein